MAESLSTSFIVHPADGVIIGGKNSRNGRETVTEDNGSGKVVPGNNNLDISEKTLVDTGVFVGEEIEKNSHCEEILTGNGVDSSKTTGEIKIGKEHCKETASNSDKCDSHRESQKFGEGTVIENGGDSCKNPTRKNCAEYNGGKTVVDESQTSDEEIECDSDSGHVGSMAKCSGRSCNGENMTMEDCESDLETFTVTKTSGACSKEITSGKTVIENDEGTGKGRTTVTQIGMKSNCNNGKTVTDSGECTGYSGTNITRIGSFYSEKTAAESDVSGNKVTVGIKGKCGKGKTVAGNINVLNCGTTVRNISDKKTGTMSGAFEKIGTKNCAFCDDEFCRKDGASPVIVTVGCSEGAGCLPETLQNIDAQTSSTKKQDQTPQSACTSEDKRQKIFNMMKELQQQYLAEALDDSGSLTEDVVEGTDQVNICRICYSFGEEVLVTPCQCTGSAQYVHASCLLTWFKESVKDTCELCQRKVKVDKKIKSLSQWRLPQQKPFPIIWFLVFVLGLLLNTFSLIFNGSEGCGSTTCLAFYVINGLGIMLDLTFMLFWWSSCLAYFKKWWALNQEWTLINNPHVTVSCQGTSNDAEEDGHNETQPV